MKEFSDYEKKILKELLRVDETPGGLAVLGNIIDFELYPNLYIELKSEDNCPVRIAKSYMDNIIQNYGSSGLSEMIKQLNNKLLFTVLLFQYLEREGQIYLTGDFSLPTLGSTFDESETPVAYELEDKKTISLIYHLSKKKIVPQESLKKYIKNNFKTESELKIEKEQKTTSRKLNWTALGVIVTIAGLIFSSTLEIIKMNNKTPNKINIIDTLRIKIDRDSLHFKVIIDKFNDSLKLDNKKNAAGNTLYKKLHER